MELGHRDKIINDLNIDIFNKNKLLIERYKHLKDNSQNNKLLEDVLNNYKTHFKQIYQQKKQQQHNLKSILLYLEKIINCQNNITETQIMQSKISKNNLINQINTIQKYIDELYPLAN